MQIKAKKSGLQKTRGATIPNRKVEVLNYQKDASDLTLRDVHTHPLLHNALYEREFAIKGQSIYDVRHGVGEGALRDSFVSKPTTFYLFA